MRKRISRRYLPVVTRLDDLDFKVELLARINWIVRTYGCWHQGTHVHGVAVLDGSILAAYCQPANRAGTVPEGGLFLDCMEKPGCRCVLTVFATGDELGKIPVVLV
jgi:hypothetical protein